MKVKFITPSDLKSLSQVLEEKRQQLNKACEEHILGRFSAVIDGKVYYFSNDEKAQLNYDKFDNALTKGYVDSITLNAYLENGESLRITLDKSDFTEVYKAHLNHIIDNTSKLKDTLEPKLKKATKEQLSKVNWH